MCERQTSWSNVTHIHAYSRHGQSKRIDHRPFFLGNTILAIGQQKAMERESGSLPMSRRSDVRFMHLFRSCSIGHRLSGHCADRIYLVGTYCIIYMSTACPQALCWWSRAVPLIAYHHCDEQSSVSTYTSVWVTINHGFGSMFRRKYWMNFIWYYVYTNYVNFVWPLNEGIRILSKLPNGPLVTDSLFSHYSFSF